MVLEDDPSNYSNRSRGTTRKYSSASDSDITTALIGHIVEMENSPREADNETPANEQVTLTSSEQQEANNKLKCECETDDDVDGDAEKHRRKSSLAGSAHIQLQLIVEDVKVELKELAQNGICIKKPATAAIVPNKKSDSEDQKNGKEGKENENEKKKVTRTGCRRYIGIVFALSSSIMFALGILVVKLLPQYHPYSKTWWRFQGILLPNLPILLYYWCIKKDDVFSTVCPVTAPGHPRTIFFLFLRGLTGASASVFQFYSLEYISMADSSVIAFSAPVFVSLASHFLLGEKSGFIPVLCGIITLGGALVITRPPMLTGETEFDTDTLIGAGLAFGCMVCATGTMLLLRHLRQMHYSVITVYFGLWGTVQSLILSATVPTFEIPEGLEDWMLAVALALLTFFGQTFIVLASKYEQAGIVALCRTCDILFAYAWQFIFLGVIPDIFSMIGGLIVVLGVLITLLRKFLSELPEDSPAKRRLWIFLT